MKIRDAKPRLLLETTAGQGSGVGHTFEQLAWMMESVAQKHRIGVCLDAFRLLMNDKKLRNIPKIIETKKTNGKDWDRINLLLMVIGNLRIFCKFDNKIRLT